jgi:hypothetical protein
MRAESLVPRQVAMAPYEVTRPFGIWRATWYTSSKKFSSFLPEGFMVFNFAGDLFFEAMV